MAAAAASTKPFMVIVRPKIPRPAALSLLGAGLFTVLRNNLQKVNVC